MPPTRIEHDKRTQNTASGVSPMPKLIHRSRFTYGLLVLAVLALSSGAGLKWVH